MFWSIGVMSNFYNSSKVKLPCSAYSVSMDLAISVNFWDTGPEAIGEDMHMYLKCFFATQGKVIVKSIFSPASQCNVQGEGSGMNGWFHGLSSRYSQAKRHLWGSLDTSYALTRSIQSFLLPENESVVALKNSKVDKLGKTDFTNLQWSVLGTLFHRLLEAHIMMGHFSFMIVVANVLPQFSFFSKLVGVSSSDFHWSMYYVFLLGVCIRYCCLIPNIFMIYYYEKYHQWNSTDRWNLQKPPLNSTMGRRVDSAVEIPDCLQADDDYFTPVKNVQHLGKRGQLKYKRILPYALIDWTTIPVAGFLFYICPQFHAQISHLWTNTLEYKVAAKPSLKKKPILAMNENMCEPFMNDNPFEIKIETLETKSVSSNVSTKGDEGFYEEFESDVSTFEDKSLPLKVV
jgi:hypothetical protein